MEINILKIFVEIKYNTVLRCNLTLLAVAVKMLKFIVFMTWIELALGLVLANVFEG